MKSWLFVCLVFLSAKTFAAPSEFDFLAQKNLTIENSNPEKVFAQTAGNIKAVFQRYKPQLDSGSKITSPLQVGGTQDEPVVKVSIRKCVTFICQTVDLDAEISLKSVRGNCDQNYILQADLRRSSQTLTDVYDRFDVSICLKVTKPGQAALTLNAQAHHADRYSSGIVQKQIFDFLQLQIQPIVKALNESLRANGSTAPL